MAAKLGKDEKYQKKQQGRGTKSRMECQNIAIVKLLGEEVKIGNINPLQIATWIRENVRAISRARLLQGGDLLVECEGEEQAEKLLKTKILGKIKMACQPPKFLTETTGVIYGIPLEMIEDKI